MKTRIAALLLAIFALPAVAQQDEAAARRGVEAVTKLIAQRPDDPTLYFYLARFQSRAGDAKACTAALEKVLELGDGLLPVRDFGFERVWGDPGFQAVRAKIEAKLPRADTAPVAFRLEDTHLLPEGIAYDAPSRTFFVGSTAKKKIVRVGPGKLVADFSKPADRLDYVLGLAVDSPRRRLYAVSTNALTEAGEKNPRNAVVAYNIDNGEVVRSVQIVAARQLNDVAVAPGRETSTRPIPRRARSTRSRSRAGCARSSRPTTCAGSMASRWHRPRTRSTPRSSTGIVVIDPSDRRTSACRRRRASRWPRSTGCTGGRAS